MDISLLIKHLLPEDLFKHFDLVNLEENSEGQLILELDEKPVKPKEHSDKDLISKGFHSKVEIQDFPLRGKAVYLRVRRRKWIDKKTGKVYSTNWELTAKGTSYTKEFAAFLKELLR